jgi:hypothetical protein
MTKPTLPPKVAAKLPRELVHLIYSFTPHFPPKPPSPSSLQRVLEKFQRSPKRTAMDMYGLDDFVLN